MDFVSNWVTNKVADYAKTGIQAGGTLAGNAVGGVGTLLENSGRAVGQSANGLAGAIGGVGNYINNYGQTVQNSMAADGPVSVGGGGGVQKKTAVKVTKTPSAVLNGRPASVASGTARTLPSTTATRGLPRPVLPSTSSLPAKRTPPARTTRNLPSKKPSPVVPAAAVKNYPSKPPPVSTSQSARTADGKITISPASRGKPMMKTSPAAAVPKAQPKRFDTSKRPSISTSQSERTADGKVKISAASRPRAVRV